MENIISDGNPVSSEPAGDNPVSSDSQKPPWGDDFNPERAWGLIQKLRDENKDAKAFKSAGITLEDAQAAIAEREQLRQAQMSELEKAQAELTVWQQKAQEATQRALAADIERHATDKFANPDLAVKLLGDVTAFAGDDGSVDVDRLGSALDELLSTYPSLGRAEPGAQPRMKPNPAQGASGGAKVSLDQQIDAAMKSGDFARTIALKQQRALAQRQ